MTKEIPRKENKNTFFFQCGFILYLLEVELITSYTKTLYSPAIVWLPVNNLKLLGSSVTLE